MKIRSIAPFTVSLLLGVAAGPALGAPDVQTGMWEVHVKTEMPGMPMAIPPVTHRYCLTKKDLVPNSSPQPGQTCRMVDRKTSGNTVTWRVECNSNGYHSSGTGKIQFSGTRYHGEMTFHMNEGGQVMEMHQVMEGRRVGACK
jgi:hypothetical protein